MAYRWTKDDLARVTAKTAPVAKVSKYRSVHVSVDGYEFDSKKEAARYNELKLLEKAGRVKLLGLQTVYAIRVNEQFIADYQADFTWRDLESGQDVVEDVKSPATKRNPVYRLKKKLVEAIYGLTIRET